MSKDAVSDHEASLPAFSGVYLKILFFHFQ